MKIHDSAILQKKDIHFIEMFLKMGYFQLISWNGAVLLTIFDTVHSTIEGTGLQTRHKWIKPG